MHLTANHARARMPNKTPEESLIFWIVKIMAATVGQTAADFQLWGPGPGNLGHQRAVAVHHSRFGGVHDDRSKKSAGASADVTARRQSH